MLISDPPKTTLFNCRDKFPGLHGEISTQHARKSLQRKIATQDQTTMKENTAGAAITTFSRKQAYQAGAPRRLSSP